MADRARLDERLRRDRLRPDVNRFYCEMLLWLESKGALPRSCEFCGNYRCERRCPGHG